MQAKREEALDIFRKWLSEGAIIRCDVSFSMVASSLRGRVVSVTDDRIEIRSDDLSSELVLSIPRVPEFLYGEPRDFPNEAERFESGLVAMLPDKNIISFTKFLAKD